MIVRPNDVKTNKKLNNRAAMLVHVVSDGIWSDHGYQEKFWSAKLWDCWDETAESLSRVDSNAAKRFLTVAKSTNSVRDRNVASYFALRFSRDGSLASREASSMFAETADQLLWNFSPASVLPVLDKMEQTLAIHKLSETPTMLVNGYKPAIYRQAIDSYLIKKLGVLSIQDPLRVLREVEAKITGKKPPVEQMNGFAIPTELAHGIMPAFAKASSESFKVAHPSKLAEVLQRLTWAGLYSPGLETRKEIKVNWKRALIYLDKQYQTSGWNLLTHEATKAAAALDKPKAPYDSVFAKGLVQLHRVVAVTPNADKNTVFAALVEQAKL